MNKTKIEWTDYTLNPIKGKCKMGCSYCYARKLYDRFKWNPNIKFMPEYMLDVVTVKKPSKIFLCSTHELFGDWIPDDWIGYILDHIGDYPQHTFQILTKCSLRAMRFNFPSNVWLGATLNTFEDWGRGYFLRETSAKLKFFSFEPLLGNFFASSYALPLDSIRWIIIGAQTQPLVLPEREWVESIIMEADNLSIPVFLKNNLKPLLGENLRQEFPKDLMRR